MIINSLLQSPCWQTRVKAAATLPLSEKEFQFCLQDCADVIVSLLLRLELPFTQSEQDFCLNHSDPWVRIAALKRSDFVVKSQFLTNSLHSVYQFERDAALTRK